MIPGLVEGIATGGAGLISAYANWRQGEIGRDYNADEAQRNRDFQMSMSNTAMQRGQLDLAKAGLNPILAVNQGGASTPSGSMASASSVPDYAASVNTGLMAIKQRAEISLMKQQEQASYWQAEKLSAETASVINALPGVTANSKLLQSQVPGAQKEAEIDNSAFGSFFRYTDRAVKSVSPFTPALRSVPRK